MQCKVHIPFCKVCLTFQVGAGSTIGWAGIHLKRGGDGGLPFQPLP